MVHGIKYRQWEKKKENGSDMGSNRYQRTTNGKWLKHGNGYQTMDQEFHKAERVFGMQFNDGRLSCWI